MSPTWLLRSPTNMVLMRKGEILSSGLTEEVMTTPLLSALLQTCRLK